MEKSLKQFMQDIGPQEVRANILPVRIVVNRRKSPTIHLYVGTQCILQLTGVTDTTIAVIEEFTMRIKESKTDSVELM